MPVGLGVELMKLIVTSYKGATDADNTTYHGIGTATFAGDHTYTGELCKMSFLDHRDDNYAPM